MDNLSKLPERSLIPQGGRGDKERTVVFFSFHPLFFILFFFFLDFSNKEVHASQGQESSEAARRA